MTFFSPAKLNLFLHVVKKREDGYHELASLFQTISLGDTLQFVLSDKDVLHVKGPFVIVGTNLVQKALDLFRAKSGLKFHVAITLEKQIPLQAGLGGGSSNAATTLWGLNEILGRPVGEADLIEWSKELGSDATFFFSTGTAYCTGRGEIVRALPPLQERSCMVVKPDFGLSTAHVFKNFVFRHQSHKCLYFNDLEETACFLEPRLASIKQALLASGFDTVVMTGSGTSFFCFGSGTVPNGFQSFPVHFIFRNSHAWYPLVNMESPYAHV